MTDQNESTPTVETQSLLNLYQEICKSIHDVDARAVKKKMKDKAFARAVNRDDIVRGAAELGMPLDNVIAEVITALKSDAERLGLAGTAS